MASTVKLPEPLLGPVGYHEEWDELRTFGPGHYLHYDRNGDPMTLRQWVTGYEDASYRILGHDTVGDTCVITIWNGLARYDGGEDPTKFIFSSIESVRHEEDDATYHDEIDLATEEEALAEHNRRVSELKRLQGE